MLTKSKQDMIAVHTTTRY